MPKGPCAARVLLILLSQLFSLKDGSDWCDAISFRREKKEKRRRQRRRKRRRERRRRERRRRKWRRQRRRQQQRWQWPGIPRELARDDEEPKEKLEAAGRKSSAKILS